MTVFQKLRSVQKEVLNIARRRKFHRRTAPGAAPGTLVSDKSKHRTELRYILYGAGNVAEKPLTNVDSIPIPSADQVLWLDVIGLADADVVDAIGKRFKLHPLALEDVLHIHQRAKAEEYNDHIFLVARMVYDNEPLETEQLSLFLGENYVITFQEDPGDCFNAVRERIRTNARIHNRGADYLAYGLIDAIIDAYFPKLEKIGARLDEIDEAIMQDHGRSFLGQLHQIRRDLIQLRKLLWQHRDALNALIRQDNDLIKGDTQIYIRDCLDHVVQLMDVSETDRESCIGLQELYLAELGQRTNDIMRVLTLFSTLFMPMTFIAGVYGMNFHQETSPWNMPELSWHLGYPFSLLLMAMSGGLLTAFFWTRGWFHR